MSVNKYRPHLFVLPEDDANRQIANGFLLNPDLDDRAIQVLPPSGGWTKTLKALADVHASEMRKYSDRRMVLLIDFDNSPNRLSQAKKDVPRDIAERVFIIGTLSEPERLKIAIPGLNAYEAIGKKLAKDCADDTYELWRHDLLKHNKHELHRMILSVKPFLFEQKMPNSG